MTFRKGIVNLREAIFTHPLVVKAVVEYVLLKEGAPFISDSPGRGPFKKIFEAGGYKQALEGLDCNFEEFKDSVTVDVGSGSALALDMAMCGLAVFQNAKRLLHRYLEIDILKVIPFP